MGGCYPPFLTDRTRPFLYAVNIYYVSVMGMSDAFI